MTTALTISDAARMSGVSAHTLRYYGSGAGPRCGFDAAR